jgi:hypothetical protein
MEQTSRHRSDEPDFDGFEQQLADLRATPYRLRVPDQTKDYPKNTVPLFLSGHDDEPDPDQYVAAPARKRTASGSTVILAGVCAAAAAAVLVTLFTSDATREIVVSVKDSVLPAPSAAAPSGQSRLTVTEGQKDRASLTAPDSQTAGIGADTIPAAAPAREEIKLAYHNAIQGMAPAAPAAAAPTTPEPAIRHLDPETIASLLNRANALIASNDVAAGRLVLRRAADAGDARAALMLAETYDPTFLEKLGVHGVVPDLAMARRWYEKARSFGSAEASQQIEMLAGRQH